jgi:hypothetical protein
VTDIWFRRWSSVRQHHRDLRARARDLDRG